MFYTDRLTDGHTDRRTKLIVVFRSFAIALREREREREYCVCVRERWREEELMPTLLGTRHSIAEFAIN